MSLYNACVSFSFYCERLRSCINEPARYFLTKSPRKLLFNINIFVTVLTLVLSGFSMYVSTLIYDRSFIGGWADFVGVSIVSFAIALTCITGARGSHIVSLELLLGYFWLVVVFIGPLILGVVIALTFTRYIDVYFLHQWTEPNFSKIRDLFCHEYSDTKCLVPLSITTNLEAVNNTYCDYQTDCVTVRDSAINQAIKYGTELTISQASLCLLVLLLLGWAMYTCQFIVTSAVITQSMNDYINYLLLLSIGSSAGLAYYMWWLNEFKGGTFDYGWIPSLFIAMSIAQTVAIPFGIYAASGFAATGVLGLIIASISTSIISPGDNNANLSDVACAKRLSGCSLCSKSIGDRCPEWTSYEITLLVQADLQIAGAVAFICMLYLFGALIVASIVRNNLKNYQTDYI